MVHHAVEAVDRRSRHERNARTLAAFLCCVTLLAGCGGSSRPKEQAQDLPAPPVGSVRTADCTAWKKGSVAQRRSTVVQLRNFAGGPVGSSAGIQNGPVLDDRRAYRILQSYCTNYLARGFKLYKLYERAAAFVGH